MIKIIVRDKEFWSRIEGIEDKVYEIVTGDRVLTEQGSEMVIWKHRAVHGGWCSQVVQQTGQSGSNFVVSTLNYSSADVD